MFKKMLVALVLFVFLCPGLSLAELEIAAEEKTALEGERKAVSEVTQEYRQKLKETISAPQETYKQELDSYVRYMPTVNAKNQSGKVSVVDSASEYNYLFKLFGRIPTQAGIAADYISINNSTQLELPSKLTGISFGMESTLPFFNFNKTYFRLGLAPSFFSDGWNIRMSNFRIPMRFFLINLPNDKLVFIAGVSVRPNYRDKVLPILGFIYTPNERWVFNIVLDRPNITYNVNEKWSIFAEGDSSGGEYKVNTANFKGQILEYNEYHTGLGTSYEINKYTKLSVSGGYMFDRTIRYRNKDSGKVALEGGAYSELRVEITV
ncbi:MAG: DUF6268 family outer membrane beta-barrel protein [Candidatus Omnitrophota bacterium]|jgi:soluble cytochrome b562